VGRARFSPSLHNPRPRAPRRLPVAVQLDDLVAAASRSSSRGAAWLWDQALRAEASVVLNIAEACGRDGADRALCLRIAPRLGRARRTRRFAFSPIPTRSPTSTAPRAASSARASPACFASSSPPSLRASILASSSRARSPPCLILAFCPRRAARRQGRRRRRPSAGRTRIGSALTAA
jgi:hypothetical protein